MTSKLRVYSRSYCHLCEDMLAALEALHIRRGGEFEFEFEVLDIDADPELERRFNEWVPLLEAEGQALCHHFFDEKRVRDYLSRPA